MLTTPEKWIRRHFKIKSVTLKVNWLHGERWSFIDIFSFISFFFFFLDNNCWMLFSLKTLNKLISTILVLFKGKSQEQSSSLLGFNIKKVVLLMILHFRDLINKQQNQNLFLLLLFRKQEKKRVYFFRPSFPRKYLNYLDATNKQTKQASKKGVSGGNPIKET